MDAYGFIKLYQGVFPGISQNANVSGYTHPLKIRK